MKSAAEVCHAACAAVPDARLASLQGGDKHNAIPREASAMLLVPADSVGNAESAIEDAKAGLVEAYGSLEESMVISCNRQDAGGAQVSSTVRAVVNKFTMSEAICTLFAHCLHSARNTSWWHT